MSSKKEKKNKINKGGVQVFLTAMVFALIFLAMIGNLVLFQMKESDVAYTNSYNSKRVEAVKAETTRGTIYASSGLSMHPREMYLLKAKIMRMERKSGIIRTDLCLLIRSDMKKKVLQGSKRACSNISSARI